MIAKDEQHNDVALQLKHYECLYNSHKDCRKESLLNSLMNLGHEEIINNETNHEKENNTTLVLPLSSTLLCSLYETHN